MKTKTESDYGFAYAEWLATSGEGCPPVDIQKQIHSTVDIPDGDYTAMKRDGINEPSSRLYWMGFNSYSERMP